MKRVAGIIADMNFIIFVGNVLIIEFLFLNATIILLTWQLVVSSKKKEFYIDEFRSDVFEERLSDWINDSIIFPTDEKMIIESLCDFWIRIIGLVIENDNF